MIEMKEFLNITVVIAALAISCGISYIINKEAK